jgi:sec-independent protein translocase protein TatA
MLNNIGMSEILVLLVIALLVFGAKRLPEMGAAMGKGIREFKRSLRTSRRVSTPAAPTRLPPAGSTPPPRPTRASPRS